MDSAYFEERAREVEAPASRGARLFALGIVGASLSALTYLRLFNPLNPATNYYPACPFYTLTGLYCPGCGTVRGLHQLTHGHFLTALDYNALMVVSLPFLAYFFVSYALLAARGRGLPNPYVPPVFIKALFTIIMLFWILRNIPVYPFTLLAP